MNYGDWENELVDHLRSVLEPQCVVKAFPQVKGSQGQDVRIPEVHVCYVSSKFDSEDTQGLAQNEDMTFALSIRARLLRGNESISGAYEVLDTVQKRVLGFKGANSLGWYTIKEIVQSEMSQEGNWQFFMLVSTKRVITGEFEESGVPIQTISYVEQIQ